MRTAAAWCLLLPCAAAFAPAPPPDGRRRALTTRSAGAGELLAEVRDLARLRPTRDDIVRLSHACDAGLSTAAPGPALFAVRTATAAAARMRPAVIRSCNCIEQPSLLSQLSIH